MSELIDREVVIAELELEYDADMEDPYWSGVNAGLKTAIAKIKCMPSAEPEVRCIAKVEFDKDKLREIVNDTVKELVSAEQKQGKWFIEPSKGTITCSTCKEEISYYPSIGIKPIWDYCPYCGSYNGGEQDG